MFMYYKRQNDIICDLLNKVCSVRENNSIMDICVWNNVNYNVIVCSLLCILLITVLKYSK